jgi:electron transport complex protein RnfG
MIKRFLQQTWLVILSALVFGLLVAGVNSALTPKIEENKRIKKENALKSLLPEATEFKNVKAEGFEYTIALDATGQTVGYALEAAGSGFADKIRLLVATGPDAQTVKGFAVLASNETPGFGDKITSDFFQTQFLNAPANQLEVIKSGRPDLIDHQIVAITGATISSEAATSIVNSATTKLQTALANPPTPNE